jgi:hypothetical protein
MSPSRKKKLPLVAVHRGQVYKYKPNKKGAHTKYIRIVGVSKIGLEDGHAPRPTYRQVSKSGNLTKPKKSQPHRTSLSWDGQQWVMPFGELVEE